jgi:hypothetical protein
MLTPEQKKQKKNLRKIEKLKNGADVLGVGS